MKIHYNNALRSFFDIVPVCGIEPRDMLPATKVPQLVTCKRCIKTMGLPPCPEPYPKPAVFFMFRGEILPWVEKEGK